MWIFYYFHCERSYEVLKSKSPCFLLNQNIKFNKNETESKMENPTHSFIEINHVLQLLWEMRIKSKTVMSWSSRRKKECIFCTVYFNRGIFLNICVLSQFIVYGINFQNIYTFTCQNALLHTLSLLVFKIIESTQCILINIWQRFGCLHFLIMTRCCRQSKSEKHP